jgi:hypothetical protein
MRHFSIPFGFDNSYGATLTGPGTTEQIAWVGPQNIKFQTDGSDAFTAPGGSLISVVGPFTAGGLWMALRPVVRPQAHPPIR